MAETESLLSTCCTSNLLKHLEKTFSKASNCLKNKLQKKQTAYKKVLKLKKKIF